ncbi:hypothetical protein [Angustibacter luteus]|uniref:Biopolymer transporter ExbD n=1 Tax=Angustibacter luteus TaxID=658456 RepID=A0ABW1JDG5_9ACTN
MRTARPGRSGAETDAVTDLLMLLVVVTFFALSALALKGVERL